MTGIEDDARRVVRDWLHLIRERTGWSWSKIATAAGVARSTVTNAANDPDYPNVMGTTTITKISRATGIPPPVLPTGLDDRAAGLAEPEAVPYRIAGTSHDALIEAYTAASASLVPWELRTRALELAGYLPGDIVILDMNARPADGDVVCAQVYDFAASQAKTIWRRYQAPYLLAASTETELPVRADDKTAAIKGVVVLSIRPRKAA